MVNLFLPNNGKINWWWYDFKVFCITLSICFFEINKKLGKPTGCNKQKPISLSIRQIIQTVLMVSCKLKVFDRKSTQSCKKLCWSSCFMNYCRIELHGEILQNLSELLKFGWKLIDYNYMKYWIYSIVLKLIAQYSLLLDFENFKPGI